MKLLKSIWLEVIFTLLLGVVIFLSVKNSVHPVEIDYGKHLDQSDIEIGTMDMPDYIETIKSLDDCTTIIVVREIQGYFTTQQIIDQLKSLGFDQADTLLEEEYHSFIGIWSSGNVVYQHVGGNEAISYGQFLNNHYLYAKSATWFTGNTGDIYIDDVQYSANNRGFNIVTIDNSTEKLIDSVAYDVFVESIPLYRVINGKLTYIKDTNKE